jgi:hypothetical protein
MGAQFEILRGLKKCERSNESDEYIASSRPSTLNKSSLDRLLQDERFQKARSVLASLIVDNSEIECVIAQPLRQSAPSDQLITSYCSQLQGIWGKESLNRNASRSVHPTVRLAAYFMENTPDYAHLRIVTAQSILLPMEMNVSMFKSFLKLVHHLHFKFLKSIRNQEPEKNTNLKDIFEWIIGMILKPLKPSNSLPIIGSIEVNGKLAPWEEFSNEGLELFEPVQLKLIEYFSLANMPDEDIKTTAAFVLAKFYQEHGQI